MSASKVTVVIPNWNGMPWLDRCLQALRRQDVDFETVVVDNASIDDSVAFIERNHPHIAVVRLQTNTGFANAANVGIARATTPYVVLLNADTEVYPDWLSQLLHRIERAPPELGAISSQMLRLDGCDCIDDAGDELSWYGAATKRGHDQPARNFDREEEVLSPCAGAALYRRDFLRLTGGFDDAFFAYLEDVDLGLRGRLMGYRYLYLPSAKVLHQGHGSNLPFHRYVEWITRNRLMLFAKNIPASLLLRHAAKLLYGQVYFFVAYGRPWPSLKGYVLFLAALADVLKKRRQILPTIKIDRAELEALLGHDPPMPPLTSIAKRSLSRLLRGKRSVASSG
jgi:GT2 family glycosyltransferase